MTNLKSKILITPLFNDRQKAELLARLDEFLEADLIQTEKVIDDFNESFKSLANSYKKDLKNEITKVAREITNNQNADKINFAVNQITSSIDILIPEQKNEE